LPHLIAVLRSEGGCVGLFLGIRELVEWTRAVGEGLVLMRGEGVVGGGLDGWNGYVYV